MRTKPLLIIGAIVVFAIVAIAAVPSLRSRALCGKAYLGQAFGLEDASLEDLRSAADADPTNVVVLTDLGSALEKRKQNQSAIECFERLYQVSATRNTVAAHLINLCLAENQFNSALKYADEWIARTPNDANAFRARGKALAKLGRKEEALAAFDQSLKIDPSCGSALDRDELIGQSGALEGAFDRFLNPVMENKPSDWRALLRNAQRMYMTDNYAGAERAAAESLKLHPSFVGYFMRGRCKYKLGDLKASLPDFVEAEKRYTNTANDWDGMLAEAKMIGVSGGHTFAIMSSGGYHYAYATTLMKLNMDKEALAHLNAAEKQGMNRPDLYRARAYIYNRLGDDKAAQKDLATAKQLPQYVPGDVKETLESTMIRESN